MFVIEEVPLHFNISCSGIIIIIIMVFNRRFSTTRPHGHQLLPVNEPNENRFGKLNITAMYVCIQI